MDAKLTAIVGRFAYEGTISEIKPLGEGLINDTYKVKTAEADKPDYVLQRVNHNVFPDVDMVMRNIDAVTTHIRKKLAAEGTPDIDRRVPSTTPSRSRLSIPKAVAPQVVPSVTSRQCLPTYQFSWARPSRTSTTWSSASSNSTMSSSATRLVV